MTLKQQAEASLNALAPFSNGGQVLAAADGPLRLECDLSALERVGCQFERLAVYASPLADATPERLAELAAAISSRVTYLLEAISPVEIDREQCVVQLRSSPPQRSDDAATYYELLVRRGGAAELCRYRKTAGQPRAIVPAEVTREVLLRLIGDFESVLSGS